MPVLHGNGGEGLPVGGGVRKQAVLPRGDRRQGEELKIISLLTSISTKFVLYLEFSTRPVPVRVRDRAGAFRQGAAGVSNIGNGGGRENIYFHI